LNRAVFEMKQRDHSNRLPYLFLFSAPLPAARYISWPNVDSNRKRLNRNEFPGDSEAEGGQGQ
jgi:hypothetical protein